MEICTRMLARYAASFTSKMQVYEWVQKFKDLVQIAEDSPLCSPPSTTKVSLTAFWDHKGVILEHHLEQRQLTFKDTAICFGISLSQQFEENVISCPLKCTCSMTIQPIIL